MSIFFGIFRPQGGPVDPEAFEDMRKASERKGFDGMRIHIEEKIAVGHQMLRVSPEDEYDEQPLKSSCGRYLLVGHFRLDYRDELGDKIGLTQSQLEKTPDSALAMMAYQKWGENCVHHIEGDWAFVVFDNLLSTLALCKDRFGNSALFYGRIKNEFIFSTDPYIFHELQLRYHFTLNENAIQRMGIEGLNLKIGDTFLNEIYSLINSTYLLINKVFAIKKITYYQIPSRRLNFLFKVDYVLQFHSLLNSAIRSRLRAKDIGLFLSAGLDSSMILFFAAKELEYKNKRMFTFTSYPYEVNHMSPDKIKKISERDFVEKFVSGFKNIDSEFLCFPDFKHSHFFNSRKSTSILNPIVTPNSFWLDGINYAASKKGLRLMLNGQMGNYVVSWNAPYLNLHNLFRFDFKNLFENFKNSQRQKNISFFKFITTELIKPIYYLIRSAKNRLNYIFLKRGLEKSFLLKIQEKLKVDFSLEYHHRFSPFYTPRKIRLSLFNNSISNVGQKWFVDSTDHMLLSADPYTDKSLIEYSYSIPEYLFNLHGDKKYIHKKMMEGVLEDKSYLRHSGIPQSYDIGLRFKNDKDLINMIKEISFEGSVSLYFDVSYIKKRLVGLETTESESLRNKDATMLLKFISLYLFTIKFASKK